MGIRENALLYQTVIVHKETFEYFMFVSMFEGFFLSIWQFMRGVLLYIFVRHDTLMDGVISLSV